MTKIDVVSGFLGAGKTTLIKKLLKEALNGEKVVLIENEFGEIGVDGGFLKEAGIEIKEMNSGCICCSLVGDFGTSLKEVMDTYTPERILIEPSGVGKLSDVVKAVADANLGNDVILNSTVAVVDASKAKMYIKNFGEFFVNQIEHAGTIILSRTGNISEDKLQKAIALIREYNEKATIITTPWEQLDGKVIMETIEGVKDLEKELMEQLKHQHEHHHEHGEDCTCGCHDHEHHHEEEHECCHGHHHEEEHECCHGHHHEEEHECCHGHHHEEEHECCHGHHHEEEHECCHGHHHEEEHECCHGHHHEEEHECCHGHHHEEEHEHHHEHGEECTCGCHDHHGHHHADDVFTSWGVETPRAYTEEEIAEALEGLEDEKACGFVLRAKGMIPKKDSSEWIYFDYVPGEAEIRTGNAEVTGKLCVIGSKLQEEAIKKLFFV